jgi:hypothetical protein
VPGVTGDTGTSVDGGRVSELPGFRLGTIGAGMAGGICAAAVVADSSMAARVVQAKRIAFMEYRWGRRRFMPINFR